jgi:hypothetical protein
MACEDCARIGTVDSWHRPEERDGYGEGPALAGLNRLDTDFVLDVESVFSEAREILLGRHRDYGPGNIASGYPSPLVALIVRMGDKSERIKHLLSTEAEVYGERMRDSWLDLANYALIGVMCIDGRWPGVGVGGKR